MVNNSGGNAQGLTAAVQVLNMDGTKQWEKSAPLDSAEDSITVLHQDGVSRPGSPRCTSCDFR